MKYVPTLVLAAMFAAGAGPSRGQQARSVSGLLEELSSPNPAVCASAARSLGILRAKEAVQPLIRLLATETNGEVIIQAADTLRYLDATEAVPALKGVAGHNDSQTRLLVIQQLAILGDRPELPFLAQFLDDPKLSIQRMAAKSIGVIIGTDFGFWTLQLHGGGMGSSLGGGLQDLDALQRAKQWWAANKDQPASFWQTPAASDAKLDPAIPPPDRAKYQAVQDAKSWANPFLVLRTTGTELHSHALDGGRRLVPAGELRKVLAALPASAWPYGRVVAYQNQEPIGRNQRLMREALRALQVEAEFRPEW